MIGLGYVTSARSRDIDARMPTFTTSEAGIVGDGATLADSALEDLIGAAKEAGSSKGTGSRILVDGIVAVKNPIVLPRTGATPTNVVHLMGANNRACGFIGTSAFPENRALIEWEATTARAWHQGLSGLRLMLPNVSGVKAIHYKLNAGTPANVTAVLDERLQIQMENIYVEASNQYHTSLIRLEGSVAFSTFRNLVGDPSLGTYAADCILLHVDDWDFVTTPPGGQDSGGINYGLVEQLYASLRRGGMCALFKGRLNQSILRTTCCNGTVNEPCIHIVNGFGATLENIANEGRGEKGQIKLTDCVGMAVRTWGLGAPNEPTGGIGNGVGDGLVLENVCDSLFDTRAAYGGTPSFSASGVHAITLDADCARNEFRRVRLSASLASEVSDAGVGNYGTFVNAATGEVETLGAG